MKGANLGGSYTFAQYHVHWGADDLRGSEHTINHVRSVDYDNLLTYEVQNELLGVM